MKHRPHDTAARRNALKKAVLLILTVLIMLGSGGCEAHKNLDGTYTALDQPMPQDETTLIETIIVKGNEMTMAGKTSQQTLTFQIIGDELVFETKFGRFSYPFFIQDSNLVIDGITYVKQK